MHNLLLIIKTLLLKKIEDSDNDDSLAVFSASFTVWKENVKGLVRQEINFSH